MSDPRLTDLAAGDFESYLGWFGSHERLDAFLAIAGRLSDTEYWRLLAEVWIGHDAVSEAEDTWYDLWTDPRPGREQAMTVTERARLVALPDEVKIFRGASHEHVAGGLAWTLDREKAVWFAKEFSASPRLAWMGTPGVRSTPRLASTVVPRDRILALLTEREEDEVIVADRTGCPPPTIEILTDTRKDT
jgi:hypothetical protein